MDYSSLEQIARGMRPEPKPEWNTQGTEDNTYSDNKRYFKSSGVAKAIGIILLISAIPAFFFAYIAPPWSDSNAMAWGVLLLVGAVVAFIVAFARGDDAKIDAYCLRRLQDIKKEALRTLGIDEAEIAEADPFLVHGYDLDGKVSDDTLYRRGADGKMRSSSYSATLFVFTQEMVYCYEKSFSLIKEEVFQSTTEIFYRDIVSVQVKQAKTQVPDPGFFNANRMKNIGYTILRIVTPGGSLIEAVFDKNKLGLINQSVAAMRSLLKAKKQVMA